MNNNVNDDLDNTTSNTADQYNHVLRIAAWALFVGMGLMLLTKWLLVL